MNLKKSLLAFASLLVFASSAQTKVAWQEQTQVTVLNDGSIVSTSDASYASHAYSFDDISGYENGYFEFTVNNCYGFVGLSSIPAGGGFDKLDFGFQFWQSNTLYIVEKNVKKGTESTWAKGDVLKIMVNNKVVTYYKNGNLLYTSLTSTKQEESLYADFAFGGKNTGFDKPVIKAELANPFWLEKNYVSESSDGSIISVTDNGYGSHAYSAISIPGNKDGYFEFTVNNCYGMIGLSNSPMGGGYNGIQYGFQLWSGNELKMIENGSNVGSSSTWAKGDVLRIQKVDRKVGYYKNGNLLYTSKIEWEAEKNYSADFAFGGNNTGFNTPKMVITDLVGIEEEVLHEKNNLFYPNPVVNQLTILEASEGNIEIYDISGTLVKSIQKTEGVATFDLNFPNGAYHIRFVGKNKKINSHMVVVE